MFLSHVAAIIVNWHVFDHFGIIFYNDMFYKIILFVFKCNFTCLKNILHPFVKVAVFLKNTILLYKWVVLYDLRMLIKFPTIPPNDQLMIFEPKKTSKYARNFTIASIEWMLPVIRYLTLWIFVAYDKLC